MSLSTEEQPRAQDGRFSHKEGSAPEVALAHSKPVMGIGEKRVMTPGRTQLRAHPNLDGSVRVNAKDFEGVFERANLLSVEDRVRGVATRVEGSALFADDDSYDYSLKLSRSDGPITIEAAIDYGTGLGVTETPSVGDAMGALAETAQQAEEFGIDDVERFAAEYGYEPEPGPHPLADAETALAFAHESRDVLIMLVGKERYGDYVFGASKADHGYTGGVRWDAA